MKPAALETGRSTSVAYSIHQGHATNMQHQCITVSKGTLWQSAKGKGTVYVLYKRDKRGGCSSSSPRPWARRWRTTKYLWRVANANPELRLPSQPIDWYQIILLDDRGTCVNHLPRLHSTAGRPGFEPATCWLQVQYPNHSAWPCTAPATSSTYNDRVSFT